jgi:hypothetical protein
MNLSLTFVAKYFTSTMGGFQHAGMGKNKKVVENSPLLAFLPERAKE